MDSFFQNPSSCLERIDPELVKSLTENLKEFYDDLKQVENRNFFNNDHLVNLTSCSLPELIIKNLDDEQIWQEIELQNEEKIRLTKKSLAKCQNHNFDEILKKPVTIVVSDHENEREDEDQDDQHDEIDEQSEKSDEESENDDTNLNDMKYTDQFFNAKEMEEFLDREDRKAMDEVEKKDDEDSDLLEDEEEEYDIDGSKHYKYDDFFGTKKAKNDQNDNKKVRFENEDENMEKGGSEDEGIVMSDVLEENESGPKSSFELRQEKLKSKIESIEQEHLTPKSWQQIGEVSAKHRPQNSLLEEYVEFDHTTRLPPVITEETTVKLEDIVKQRIKDRAYDDVERKVKPVNEPHTYKTDLILDQQKSKQSLSQIYEQEYLKLNQSTKEESRNEQHEEIRKMMKDLFMKLDALTNYHYTPKLPVNEIKIISNTKAIRMEEVAPVTVNDADLLAPEEIKSKSRSIMKASEERTKTDKLRDLRHKKKLASSKAKIAEEKDRKAKVPKDKLKMLKKLGKICKVDGKDKESKKKKFNKSKTISET